MNTLIKSLLAVLVSASVLYGAGQWGQQGSNPVKDNYKPDGTTITATSTGVLTAGASSALGTYTSANNAAVTSNHGAFTTYTAAMNTRRSVFSLMSAALRAGGVTF